MLGIKFILFIILSIIILITIYFIFVRAARNLKRWKAMEPSFIKEVEKRWARKLYIPQYRMQAIQRISETGMSFGYG